MLRRALLAAPALALTPVGLAISPAGTARAAPRTDNKALAATLANLATMSRGRLTVRTLGSSRLQTPIWYAAVGTGPIRLLYVTEQHGNEPLGTEAAINALQTLGISDAPSVTELRKLVTLGIVVRANPDGHARNQRWTVDPAATGPHSEPGVGYDANRFHDPAVTPEANPVPEAAAVERAWLSLRPHIVVDFHMQGQYTMSDGRAVTASLMWPTHPRVSADVLHRSKQVAVFLRDTLTIPGGAITRYPGDGYVGIARNAYGVRGSATILVELSQPEPAEEAERISTAHMAMIALAGAAGNGVLDYLHPGHADAIPPRPA